MSLRMALTMVALVTSVACGGGGNSGPAPAPSPVPTPSPSPSPSGSSSVTIVTGASTMSTGAYAPNPINVPVGGTVTWVNNDSTSHTSTSNSGAWNSGSIAPGGQFSTTFATTGTYSYHCTIHPNMVGTLNVQ